MNCRKTFKQVNLSSAAQNDIHRIKQIWRKCKFEYGTQGDWLMGGEYSIADAMFSPIVLRFSGYNVVLNDSEKAYVQHVLDQPHMK